MDHGETMTRTVVMAQRRGLNQEYAASTACLAHLAPIVPSLALTSFNEPTPCSHFNSF
jgi:hypothetical protein